MPKSALSDERSCSSRVTIFCRVRSWLISVTGMWIVTNPMRSRSLHIIIRGSPPRLGRQKFGVSRIAEVVRLDRLLVDRSRDQCIELFVPQVAHGGVERLGCRPAASGEAVPGSIFVSSPQRIRLILPRRISCIEEAIWKGTGSRSAMVFW